MAGKNEILKGCVVPEYLACNGARDPAANAKYVVMTMRLGTDPAHPFKPTDIALPVDVARRLVKDLQQALMSPI